jgi:hypothetical protein
VGDEDEAEIVLDTDRCGTEENLLIGVERKPSQ